MTTAADLIREELEAREMSVRRLSNESGLSEGMVWGLLAGRIVITPEIAAGLSRAFGTSAEVWLKLGRGEG